MMMMDISQDLIASVDIVLYLRTDVSMLTSIEFCP